MNRIKYNLNTYKYTQLYGKLVAMDKGLKLSEFIFLPLNDMKLALTAASSIPKSPPVSS